MTKSNGGSGATVSGTRHHLAIYCSALFGAEPAGGFIELRYKRGARPGMGQAWLAVEQPESGFDPILRLGQRTDVYVGVLPRVERSGRRDAVERGHVLYVDCDTPSATEALERFHPAPSLIVGSGNGRHAYWSLWPPATPDAIERANRRLAYAIGADSRATDAARILRPPGTFNHRGAEPLAVKLLSVNVETFTVAEVVGELSDPPRAEPQTADRAKPIRPAESDQLVSALLVIPPVEYVERLTGRTVDRGGKATCPFHAGGQERTPSLHAYPSPDQGWACFGCEPPAGKDALGGDLFDFAARLWSIEPRGRGFFELRDRLAGELLGETTARAA